MPPAKFYANYLHSVCTKRDAWQVTEDWVFKYAFHEGEKV
jgi:hypothetical protein